MDLPGIEIRCFEFSISTWSLVAYRYTGSSPGGSGRCSLDNIRAVSFHMLPIANSFTAVMKSAENKIFSFINTPYSNCVHFNVHVVYSCLSKIVY